MRSIVLISSGVIGIGAMILLAIALAQRDARHENKLADQLVGSIPPKKAQGIPLNPDWENDAWPPSPVIRGNDSPIGTGGNSSTKAAKDRDNPFRSPAAALNAFSNQNRGGALAEPPPLQYRPLPGANSTSRPSGNNPLRGDETASPLVAAPSMMPSISSPNESGTLSAPAPSVPNGLSAGPTLSNSGLGAGASSLDNSLPELPASSGLQPTFPGSGSPTLPGPTSPTLPGSTSPTLPGSVPPTLPGSGNLMPLDSSRNVAPSPIPAPSPFANSMGSPSALGSPNALGSPLPSNAPSTRAIDSELPELPSSLPELPSSLNAPNSSSLDRSSTSLSDSPKPPTLAPNAVPPVPATVRMQPPQLEGPATGIGNPIDRSSSASLTGTSAPSAAMTPTSSKAFGEVHNAGPFRAFTSPSPGVRQLEGAQNPNIEIQKRAPAEVQVGLPATVTLLVRNVGNATAFDVRVSDSVPQGAKLTRTSPEA
ncbi:MAG: hypothetical protein MUC43_16235, partial [Pirellula sp.]|nr:hypothetical protein [Pirellula sp.]